MSPVLEKGEQKERKFERGTGSKNEPDKRKLKEESFGDACSHKKNSIIFGKAYKSFQNKLH